METPNYYEERAKSSEKEKARSNKNENIVQADKKENLTEIIKNVMIDAGLAVVGGGLTSSILGRLSLPVGLLITGYGHHKKNNTLRILGIGIMASASMANTNQNPKATIMENMSERVKAFGAELKSKLCLDLLQNKHSIKKDDKLPDLKGTDAGQPDFTTVSNETNLKTNAPPASFFEKPETEYLRPETVTSIEKQKVLLNNFNDLGDWISIEERLL